MTDTQVFQNWHCSQPLIFPGNGFRGWVAMLSFYTTFFIYLFCLECYIFLVRIAVS